MTFADFTPQRLTQQFGVRFQASHLFAAASLPTVMPSAWLVETLQRGRRLGFNSEKSRSERLVSPILTELSVLNQEAFVIYSGMPLQVDEAEGLTGECDFLLSFSQVQDFVVAPIFAITEAKKQDIEQGTIQCAAQMIAAQRLNEAAGQPQPVLYGCSTTGIEWRFLKLADQTFTLDNDRYLLTELPQLLGVLQHIIEAAQKAFTIPYEDSKSS